MVKTVKLKYCASKPCIVGNMRLFAVILAFAVLFSVFAFAQQNDCDYKVDVLLDSQEFTKENFTWKMKAAKIEGISTNITGTASIESNNNIVKSYRPWTNLPISKQKTSNTYSPNLDENEYKITAEIFVECNDVDKTNNADVKTFRIIGQNSDVVANFDENGEVTQPEIQQELTQEQTIRLNETKNDTINNETINNEKTTANNENPQINKNNQQNQIQTQNTAAANENFNNVINLKEEDAVNMESDIVYESSNEKAKELIIYSILGLSVLLNIILICRKYTISL